MSTDLTTIQTSMCRLDEIASSAALLTTSENPFSQALTMAKAIKDIRSELTDEIMEEVIMPLMNTKLGFRTDKDPNRPVWSKQERRMVAPEPYPVATVRECAIEAFLRGLVSVGNCWNIISGQAYVTKEGFWFLIRTRVPGLTDFKLVVGVPKMIRPAGDARNASDEEAKGALVTCSATWKLHGKEDRCEREIPIRVNAMMGADAIMGKAERKILAASYAQITGTSLGDADIGEHESEPTPMRDATPPAAPPARDLKPMEVPPAVKPADEVLPPAPVEKPAAKSIAQRKDDALAAIEEALLGFDDITIPQFESLLRKRKDDATNIGATQTLRSVGVDRLEAIALQVPEIINAAREAQPA